MMLFLEFMHMRTCAPARNFLFAGHMARFAAVKTSARRAVRRFAQLRNALLLWQVSSNYTCRTSTNPRIGNATLDKGHERDNGVTASPYPLKSKHCRCRPGSSLFNLSSSTVTMISAFAALALAGAVLAAPAPIERSTTVSAVSASTISTYAPYTRFASAAYCSTASTWTCGQFRWLRYTIYALTLAIAQLRVSSFLGSFLMRLAETEMRYRNVSVISRLTSLRFNAYQQSGYVGWWPTQSTVVVGHQGTDPTQL